MNEKKELREYQERIVNKTLASDKDIVICLPTAGGKTVIASGLISRLENKVIFIVPRLELIKQAKDEFGDVDIIWADRTSIEDNHCIIASKDSLRMQYNKLPQNIKDDIRKGTAIIDEAHVSLKQSYNLVKLLSPSRVIGLTATPERMDGLALLKGDDAIHKYGIFDELMQEETVPSLIRKGYLCKLRYYARPIKGIDEIKPENKKAEELSGNQMIKIFNDNNIWGDLVNSYEEYGRGRPSLGFTTTIAMGEQVAQIFQDAGYDFRVIHGDMPVKERQVLIDKLGSGEIDGLVNASLLTYGFNCPPVSYAFNCRHIKSRPLWFQIVGRILRICEGKEDAIFVDHADSISEFSDPDCSLPILDETISWRVDGESKELKQQRKLARKKVQNTMAIIQELDPLPSELVEITVENTWERLVRIIQKLRSENALLIQNKEELEQNNALLSQEKSLLAQKVSNLSINATSLKDQNYQLMRKVENIQHIAEREKQQLLDENEKLRAQGVVKVMNAEETFNYIRTHYIPYRRQIERANPGISREEAHKRTWALIKMDENKLPFLFDTLRLNKGYTYWFNNYEKRIEGG